jgi:hypothetical protein
MSLKLACVIVAGTALAGTSSAVVQIFTGTDPGTQFGSPRPNSNTAASNFDTIAGSINSINVITWEQFGVGVQAPYSPFAGVTITQTNVDTAGGFNGISGTNSTQLGYNTTFGGNRFLQVGPNFNATDTTTRFNFANGINAFGFYITGHQSDFPGRIVVEFVDSDNNARSFAVDEPATLNGMGATTFWGFVDDSDAFITSVTIRDIGDRSASRDVYGLDDIRFTNCAVPEPASIACMLFGAAALLRRRKK